MRSEKEIRKMIKELEKVVEYWVSRSDVPMGHYYTGCLYALEWVLEEREEI